MGGTQNTVSPCWTFNKTIQRPTCLSEWLVATYSRPVLSHEPQMVGEEWANADEEQGGHDEQKQDVELGVRVGQLFL